MKLFSMLFLGYITGNLVNIIISILLSDIIISENRLIKNEKEILGFLSLVSDNILFILGKEPRKARRLSINKEKNYYINKKNVTVLVFVWIPFLYYYSSNNLFYFIYNLIFTCFLLMTIEIDLDYLIICDEINIFFAILAFVLSLYKGRVIDSLIGGLIGFVLYYIIYKISIKAYGYEAFGFGDVLFNGVIGMYLGINKIVFSSILSFFVALFIIVIKKIFQGIWKKDEKNNSIIPFGPSMGISAFISLLFGDEIIKTYFSYIGI